MNDDTTTEVFEMHDETTTASDETTASGTISGEVQSETGEIETIGSIDLASVQAECNALLASEAGGSAATTESAPAAEAAPAPVEAPKPRPIRRIPETRHLKRELSAERARELLNELSDCIAQKKTIEVEKKLANDTFKDRLAAVEAKILEIDEANKECNVDVKCERQIDYDSGLLTVVRLDTNEILEQRALTAEERHGALEFGTSDPAKRQLAISSPAPLSNEGKPVEPPSPPVAEPPRYGVRFVGRKGGEPKLLTEDVVDVATNETETITWTWATCEEAQGGAESMAEHKGWRSFEIVAVDKDGNEIKVATPATEYVVRLRDKETGNEWLDCVPVEGSPYAVNERTFATSAEADAWVAEQLKHYGETTEYTVEARAVPAAEPPIAVEANELVTDLSVPGARIDVGPAAAIEKGAKKKRGKGRKSKANGAAAQVEA